ncbi:MAG TPA: hypothetical protein PLR18_01895 [bacterium]|nr:hypothetical protein [bacterium]
MPVLPFSSEKSKTAPSPAPREFDVRTLPSKFLNMRSSIGLGSHSSRLKKNIFFGLVLVIVLGGAMALAAWLFLKSVKKEAPVIDYQPVNTQSTTLDQQPIAVTPTSTAEELNLDYLLDTNQWQSYIDSVYNYTLKYPAEWTFRPSSLPSVAYALSSFSLQGKDGLGDVSLSLFDNPKGLSLFDWLSQEYGLDSIDCEPYKLDSQDTCRYSEATGKSFVIYAAHNQHLYIFKFIISEKMVVNQVYNQILANWHFPPLSTPSEEDEDLEGLDPAPATDSDSDGLTDREEIIYRTNKDNFDTDGDSYQDGLEVANLYNPVIAGSAKLLDSDMVKTHVDESHHYNLIYPASWKIIERPGYVMFQDLESEEFIQIIIEDNSRGYKNVREWYENYLKQDPNILSDVSVNGSIPAVMTDDKMKIYFFFGDNVYGFIYNPNLRQYGNFFTTFNMMVKSFHLMTNN